MARIIRNGICLCLLQFDLSCFGNYLLCLEWITLANNGCVYLLDIKVISNNLIPIKYEIMSDFGILALVLFNFHFYIVLKMAVSICMRKQEVKV